MKKIVVKIAQEAIQLAFENSDIDPCMYTQKYPWLLEDGACFVTLNLHGALRGCIGSLEAKRPLVEDIAANAFMAAFRDPRFTKLTPKEFQEVSIEVSILSKPQQIQYSNIDELRSKIRPYTDGVIIQMGARRATFLPQVWEQLPDFESFFSHLLQKARLDSRTLENHPDVFTYSVEKYTA